MGLDRQLEELCSVYNERSDAELLSMHENRDDLTELAQDALAQVMRERKLSVSGVPVSHSKGDSSDTLEIDLKADEVNLQNFDDAFRLNEALRVLTQAEIACRVVNLNAGYSQTGDSYRQIMQLGLIVGKTDEAQARELLQAAMKLFPAPEGDDDPFAELDGLMVVDVFSRSDALRIAHAFGSASISFLWIDGSENLTMTEDEVRIEVYLRHLEEAQKLAQQTLGR